LALDRFFGQEVDSTPAAMDYSEFDISNDDVMTIDPLGLSALGSPYTAAAETFACHEEFTAFSA